jgi:L-serine/L-threonine ammonia-lyase
VKNTTLHQHTPLLAHHRLSRELKKSVWLKMENTQPSGSFKMRGLGTLCQRAAEGGAKHFVCPSGGNAGFAAAMSGVALGIKTTIIVPETTSHSVRVAIEALGAELIVIGAVWDESNQAALAMSRVEGAVYIPPFDHPDIWDGNASLIDEAVQQAQFDVVVCSVGGGGLLAGVVQGLQRNGLSNVPVVAAETEGAASFNAAVKAGEVVTLDAITTIATTLGSKRVAQRAFDLTREHTIHSVTVTDRQATDACVDFANDLRTLVEPACGAALAVAYQNLDVLKPFKRPLIIVCGGIAVDLKKIQEWGST